MSVTLSERLRPVWFPPYALTIETARRLRGRTFLLDGREHRYFTHRYNETWRNERSVEIPLALEVLRGRTLELGNVLAHYGVHGQVVVDKYEEAPGVHNVDIVDFDTDLRFDTIVSISTIEHVGFDEDLKDEAKPRRAVARLKELLAPGGTLFVTLPLGYNPGVDVLVAPGAGVFDEVRYLKRSADFTTWAQAEWEDVRGCVYDPERAATALAVCTARR